MAQVEFLLLALQSPPLIVKEMSDAEGSEKRKRDDTVYVLSPFKLAGERGAAKHLDWRPETNGDCVITYRVWPKIFAYCDDQTLINWLVAPELTNKQLCFMVVEEMRRRGMTHKSIAVFYTKIENPRDPKKPFRRLVVSLPLSERSDILPKSPCLDLLLEKTKEVYQYPYKGPAKIALIAEEKDALESALRSQTGMCSGQLRWPVLEVFSVWPRIVFNELLVDYDDGYLTALSIEVVKYRGREKRGWTCMRLHYTHNLPLLFSERDELGARPN